MEDYRLLVINPGSTSTKLGIFQRDTRLFVESITHAQEKLGSFERIVDQESFRFKTILEFLATKSIDADSFDAVVGRGGLLQPLPSGTYLVTPQMLKDLRAGVQGEHASNLGGILAARIAERCSCRAFIVDPVVVDELLDLARYTGFPEIRRRSIFHALNHKAVARRAARDLGRNYGECNLIIAHLGGGISVGAHHKGRVIDVNNALNGDGPFAPERAGTVPASDLVDLCFSGTFTRKQLKKRLAGRAGVVAYLATNNMRDIEARIDAGDTDAEELLSAMAFQVAKEIGSRATVLKGDIDAIVLTGGLAHDKRFVRLISSWIDFLGRIMVYPGEDEMQSLAEGGLRVLDGEEEARIYAGTYH